MAEQQEFPFAAGEPGESNTRLTAQWKQLQQVKVDALIGNLLPPVQGMMEVPVDEPIMDESEVGVEPNDFNVDWPDDWDHSRRDTLEETMAPPTAQDHLRR